MFDLFISDVPGVFILHAEGELLLKQAFSVVVHGFPVPVVRSGSGCVS